MEDRPLYKIVLDKIKPYEPEFPEEIRRKYPHLTASRIMAAVRDFVHSLEEEELIEFCSYIDAEDHTGAMECFERLRRRHIS